MADIYGNPDGAGLAFGGTIEGDLEVKGDGEFENLNVLDTLTTDVLISRETVETKDTLLHLGVDNVADVSNLGTYWEYDNGGKKYGGLVRSAGQKKAYLFKDETVKPTPSSIIVNYPREDLVLNNLESKNTHAQNNVTVGDETDNGRVVLLNSGFSQFFRYESVTGGVGFETFKARGDKATPLTVLGGDVLSTNIANGHDGTSFVQTGRNSYVANENFSAGNNGTRYELEITPNGTATKKKYLELTGAHLAIGDVAGSTDYKLPTTRGTLNQVLKTDASGGVSWVNADAINPFDQSLNTTDDVKFDTVRANGLEINDIDPKTGGSSGTINMSGKVRIGYGGGASGSLSISHNDVGDPDIGIIGGDAVDKFRICLLPGDETGEIVSETVLGGEKALNWDSSGWYFKENLRLDDNLTIGSGVPATQYTFPSTRGTLDQILKTDGAGVLTWQSDNPFNQSLNTSDFVQFNRALINDTGTSGSTDLTSVGLTIMTRASSDSTPPGHIINKARGTRVAPTAVNAQDKLYELNVEGHDGTGYVQTGSVRFTTLESFTPSTTGSAFQVDITEFGDTGKKQYLELSDQGLLIGSNPDNTYYTLPVTRGTNNQILKTDASGVVGWSENAPLESLSSGVLTGGIMTINVDDTKFDISDGTGQITQGAVKTPVSWSGLTAQSTAYAGILTYVSINSAGNPVYSPTKPNNSALRDNIFLGVLVHPNAVNLVAIDNEQLVLQNTTNQIHDLANAIGFINTSGNQLLPSGANLTFQKLAGTMFAFGSNYKNDVKNPHDVSTPLVDTAGAGTFQYRYQDGSSGPTTSTLIIPGEYDDGNGQGSPGAIGTNNWQVQRIYLFTAGNVIIQPGQVEYKDYADAIQGYETEAFVTEPSIAENGLLIGYLVVRGGGTNLNIAGDGVFINAGKFGSSTSGGIGGTTHAHGQQYFISNTGETVITLTDTYYDITGTRLDSELNEISAQAQSLTYTGSTMRTLKLETHFSWQGPPGASAENYRAAFFKNGSLIVPGQMTGALQTGGNYPRNMSSSVITTAVQNDIFTVKVKNVTATQNVVIKDFQFIISDI